MEDKRSHDQHCLPCIYYGKSTMSCDYILIEDQMRPCPAGAGCKARITRKEAGKRVQTKWDTELGRRMHLEGRSDKEIAEHFGIAVSTVSYQRRKSWEEPVNSPQRVKQFLQAQQRHRAQKPPRCTPYRYPLQGSLISTRCWKRQPVRSKVLWLSVQQKRLFSCGDGAAEKTC